MTRSINATRDRALNDLTSEFSTVPVRIVIDVFTSYLECATSLATAVIDARARIVDACAA